MNPLEIKATRLELGFTQAQLGEAIGVSRTAIIGWERADPCVAPQWFGLAVAAFIVGLEPYRPSTAATERARGCRRIDKRWVQPLLSTEERTALKTQVAEASQLG